VIRAAFVAASVAAVSVHAQAWQTVSTGKISIKARAIPGTPVHEVLAEGDVDAPAQAIAEAWLDVDRYPSFMPYVKAARLVDAPRAAGRVTYTELSFPVCAGRDFVITDKVTRTLAKDGEFVDEWTVADGLLKERANVVRLKLNSGSLRAKPIGDGSKSHVVYQFAVDPGGFIPGWLADMGNRSAVPDAFRAIEKEAQRRATASPPPSSSAR
jgi:hypothetical protein